jgi:hypothetical protein
VLRPTVGRILHYTSYGTPGGEYGSACRAAIVTQVNGSLAVGLAILNPTGMFFNEDVDPNPSEGPRKPGTWHWPGGTLCE